MKYKLGSCDYGEIQHMSVFVHLCSVFIAWDVVRDDAVKDRYKSTTLYDQRKYKFRDDKINGFTAIRIYTYIEDSSELSCHSRTGISVNVE